MNSNRSRRIALTIGAAAGGLLAAAFLPMAVANADGYYAPDLPSLHDLPGPLGEVGICPLFCIQTGTEDWNTILNAQGVGDSDTLSGSDSMTQILTFENNLFTVTNDISDPHGLAVGSLIDYANFGFGFGNEFIDAAAGSTNAGIFDILITPGADILI
jgi:hypothetical protein